MSGRKRKFERMIEQEQPEQRVLDGNKTAASSLPRYITILEEYVKKDKKNYHYLPDTILYTPDDKDQWFSFYHSRYFPFSVVDRKTGEKTMEPVRFHIDLSVKNNNYYSPYRDSEVSTKGVLWIRVFKIHVNKGILVYKVTTDRDDIEPLIKEIKIEDEITRVKREKDEKNNEKGADQPEEDEDDAIEAEGGRKSKRGRRSSENMINEKESKIMSKDISHFDSTCVLVDSSQLQSNVAFLEEASSSSSTSDILESKTIQFLRTICEIPVLPPLSLKQRIEQTLISSTSSIIPNNSILLSSIHTSPLTVKIPNSLVISLYNDKTVISSVVVSFLKTFFVPSLLSRSQQQQYKKVRTEVQRGFERLLSPSCTELFAMLHEKSASHVSNASSCISFLKILMSKILFSHLLYQNEKVIFPETLLKDCGISSTESLEYLGPYYFLRFIVVVIMNVSSDSSSSLSSSSNRKEPINELRKILEIAIKILDENSSHYFVS
jgi:hypothetical protein